MGSLGSGPPCFCRGERAPHDGRLPPALQAPADVRPQEQGCTPLRPSYAPDLRDEALLAANATAFLTSSLVNFTFTEASPFSCTVRAGCACPRAFTMAMLACR